MTNAVFEYKEDPNDDHDDEDRNPKIETAIQENPNIHPHISQ